MSNQSSSFDVILKKRVVSVCDLHRIPSGSPENLKTFLYALQENKLLAMDFWGIVGGVSAIYEAVTAREAETSFADTSIEWLEEQTVSAVISAVTGLTVAEMIAQGGESKRSVEELQYLVSGVDTHAPMETEDDAFEAPEPAAPPVQHNVSGYLPASTEPKQTKRTAKSSSGDKPAPGQGAGATENPAWSDILSTDWIAADAKAAQSKRRVVSDPSRAAFYGDRDLRRLLLEEENTRVIEGSSASESKGRTPWGRLPMWIKEPSHAAAVLGCLTLIVGICVIAVKVRESGLLSQVGSSAHSMWNELAGSDQVRPAVASDAAAAKTPGSPVVHKRKPASAELKLVSTAEARSKASANGVNDFTEPATASDGSTPVEVLSDVMRSNLIISTAPVVPKPGQGDGHVVLRVIISKTGVVESLRVVEGDAAMGAAAIQGVLTWRYRPYLVNGQPVAVVTTVTAAVKIDPNT